MSIVGEICSVESLRYNGLKGRCDLRLDKFLKVSRLIKRRTVANTVSDSGRVFVNGNPAKPAKQLKEGDILEIEYASGTLKVRVVRIPLSNVSVQEADSLYEKIMEN